MKAWLIFYIYPVVSEIASGISGLIGGMIRLTAQFILMIQYIFCLVVTVVFFGSA